MIPLLFPGLAIPYAVILVLLVLYAINEERIRAFVRGVRT